MKILSAVFTIFFLILGTLLDQLLLSIIGSLTHVAYSIVDLCRWHQTCKKGDFKANKSKMDKFGSFLQSMIYPTAIICLFIAHDKEIYQTPPFIVILSAAISYFAAGEIMRKVCKVPLSMGPGGWDIRRTKNGRYWR